MNKISKNTLLSRFALLLLAVFISSLVIKPAHILLSNHRHIEEGITTTQSGQMVTTNHYVYCPILDFEFCTFIPQKQTAVPKVNAFAWKEQTSQLIACLADKSSHLFQLRAPPTL